MKVLSLVVVSSFLSTGVFAQANGPGNSSVDKLFQVVNCSMTYDLKQGSRTYKKVSCIDPDAEGRSQTCRSDASNFNALLVDHIVGRELPVDSSHMAVHFINSKKEDSVGAVVSLFINGNRKKAQVDVRVGEILRIYNDNREDGRTTSRTSAAIGTDLIKSVTFDPRQSFSFDAEANLEYRVKLGMIGKLKNILKKVYVTCSPVVVVAPDRYAIDLAIYENEKSMTQLKSAIQDKQDRSNGIH